MPETYVKAPDGTFIKFPDGMDDNAITGAMNRLYSKGITIPLAGMPLSPGGAPPSQAQLDALPTTPDSALTGGAKLGYMAKYGMPPPSDLGEGIPGFGSEMAVPATIMTGIGIAHAPLGTLSGLAAGEAARRTAAHFGLPGWAQMGADIGVGALTGGATSRLGKIPGLSSLMEEYAASRAASKTAKLAAANRVEGNIPIWEGKTQPQSTVSQPEINANGLPLNLPSGRSVGPAPGSHLTPTSAGRLPLVANPAASTWEPTPVSGDINSNGLPLTTGSGRSVGPAPVVPPVGPIERAPLWQGITDVPQHPSTVPTFEDIKGLTLPSGRTPNSPFRSGPSPVVEGEPTVAGQPLPPIDKFEMNRLIHARAQEMNLPGSPAGTNGHPQLSAAAKAKYGAKSFSDLSTQQMRELYDYMEKFKALPTK